MAPRECGGARASLHEGPEINRPGISGRIARTSHACHTKGTSDTHGDWRLQPSLTTKCILMHAPCQTAALLAIPSFGLVNSSAHASPVHPHASNRRGITHQAIDGVERPFLPRWSQKPHGEASPTQVFSFDKRLFSWQFASFH